MHDFVGQTRTWTYMQINWERN